MPSNRERAVQLREEGLSLSQIAAALGLKSGGGRLSQWLKDVPPPEWTKRPNAKDDLREQAVAMRKEGKSYREIMEVVPVSKGTLSLWLRGVPLTDAQMSTLAERKVEHLRSRAASNKARRLAKEATAIAEAAAQIPELAQSELFVAGVAAYWCEGAKGKPWRPDSRVQFINSDPGLIRLFLRWLELMGVAKERLGYRVAIHDTADDVAAAEYWASVVGVPTQRFLRTTLKPSKPNPHRKYSSDYHGCLVVTVRRGAELYRQIAGWWAGIADAVVR